MRGRIRIMFEWNQQLMSLGIEPFKPTQALSLMEVIESGKAIRDATIPNTILQDKFSAKLTAWLNAQTAKQNAAIEALTAK